MATPSQPVGQMVSHYSILRKIGGGGMGIVYEAEDLRSLDRARFDVIVLAQNERTTASSRLHPSLIFEMSIRLHGLYLSG